ncbi:hypothetical protein BU23DRAFT_544378 [Bimuria novae-zelandiae CBS 107.79]|uniref:Uncharacterized protein n=1 Tax=Bimuria novae-zelandiae CBS 107.79 TaxID=1447943 RepID=A0A6A5URC0_9PLEO|nr:hypothetical protein BU23DRAFT_544378 [Bimuria novae-zelandiae CBS 107.79]
MSSALPASEIHLHEPCPPPGARCTYIIYFITGNPGLIEYYRTFLTHLYGLLTRDAPSSTVFHVFGRSLSGFEIDFASREAKLDSDDRPPYGLQEQITRSQEALENLVRDVKNREGARDVRIILMGHSLGTYMLLEVIRRVREKAKLERDAPKIIGGVCLFATVVDIAKSDSGRKATSLLKIGQLPRFASRLTGMLTFFIPLSFLTFLVKSVMGYPADAAHVTAAFVKSQYGVHQALHMARDEMREMAADTWDEEIWGALSPSTHPHPRPILRFLFAEKDHWIADETRDELIKARGGIDGEDHKPVMEIDQQEGWVHAFCIQQSVPVADRVYNWVRDMIILDEAR